MASITFSGPLEGIQGNIFLLSYLKERSKNRSQDFIDNCKRSFKQWCSPYQGGLREVSRMNHQKRFKKTRFPTFVW